MKNSVCAIIVTWNSGDAIARSLPNIAPQVGAVVVVDNGSHPEEISRLEAMIKKFPSATLLRNDKNYGIAQALNRGASYAKAHNFAWFITLDDAARPEHDMVEKLFAAYDALSQIDKARTAIVAPNYTTIKGPVYPDTGPGFVETTVQTGQVVSVAAWEKIGGFKEDLFITGVDHEFCFRMLREGFKTLLVPGAMLEETAGASPVVRSLFGKKFVVPNYSVVRYYYIYRNNYYLYTTYWNTVRRWILKSIIGDLYVYGKIVLFEKDKIKKTGMILRGIFDGMRDRYGQLP